MKLIELLRMKLSWNLKWKNFKSVKIADYETGVGIVLFHSTWTQSCSQATAPCWPACLRAGRGAGAAMVSTSSERGAAGVARLRYRIFRYSLAGLCGPWIKGHAVEVACDSGWDTGQSWNVLGEPQWEEWAEFSSRVVIVSRAFLLALGGHLTGGMLGK